MYVEAKINSLKFPNRICPKLSSLSCPWPTMPMLSQWVSNQEKKKKKMKKMKKRKMIIKGRQLLQPFVWSMTSRLNMIRWAWDAENENASFIKLFLSQKWSFRLGFREYILPVWNFLGMKSLFFVFYTTFYHYLLMNDVKQLERLSEVKVKHAQCKRTNSNNKKQCLGNLLILSGNDHEIKFHEIKIAIFHEIKNIAKLIMRSKLIFFRRSNFFAKLIRRSKRP